eukprot:scaffold2.g6818.t1
MDYSSQFFSWLNDTFPTRPGGPPHRLSIAGRHASTSSLFALCFEALVPQASAGQPRQRALPCSSGHPRRPPASPTRIRAHARPPPQPNPNDTPCIPAPGPQPADLVVLEFAVNDFSGAPSEAALDNPQRRAFETLIHRTLLGRASVASGAPAVAVLEYYAWQYSRASYYDVPLLSVRNAAYHPMRAGTPGFRVDVRDPSTANLTDEQRAQFFLYDDHHPAGDTGCRAMADLLVAVVRQAALEVAVAPGGAGALAPATAPPEALPPPMFPGNHATLQAAMLNASGFAWAAQAPDRATIPAQKWGVIADQPGDSIDLQVDTRLPADQQQQQQAGPPGRGKLGFEPLATLRFLYTRSWQRTGDVGVTCLAGCRCRNTTLPGRWERQSTQSDVVGVTVTQHERCRLRLSVANSMRGDGCRVVLSGLILTSVNERMAAATSQDEHVVIHVSPDTAAEAPVAPDHATADAAAEKRQKRLERRAERRADKAMAAGEPGSGDEAPKSRDHQLVLGVAGHRPFSPRVPLHSGLAPELRGERGKCAGSGAAGNANREGPNFRDEPLPED